MTSKDFPSNLCQFCGSQAKIGLLVLAITTPCLAQPSGGPAGGGPRPGLGAAPTGGGPVGRQSGRALSTGGQSAHSQGQASGHSAPPETKSSGQAPRRENRGDRQDGRTDSRADRQDNRGERQDEQQDRRDHRYDERTDRRDDRYDTRTDRRYDRTDYRDDHGYHRHHHYNHYHYDHWRRHIRTRRLFTAGMVLLTRPRQPSTVYVSGSPYVYSGGVYYVQQGTQYVVTTPPQGAVVYAVPETSTVVYADQTPYLYYEGAYYVKTDQPAPEPESASVQSAPPQAAPEVETQVASASDPNVIADAPEIPEMVEGEGHNFEVVAPPIGATVPYLPGSAEEKGVDGRTYFVDDDGTYYRPFESDGETIYMVVAEPQQA